MKKTLNTIIFIFCTVSFLMIANGWAETLKTRIGKLEFTHDFANSYPTDATVDNLFDEMDFQRACQAYLWSIPIVSMAQWQHSQTKQLGAGNGQIVFLESYEDKLEGMTYNATIPYALPSLHRLQKPSGERAKNWIPTEAGRAWFPYLRLYSPKKAFLDRKWVLPDIEKVN